jgi:hypothetical protein
MGPNPLSLSCDTHGNPGAVVPHPPISRQNHESSKGMNRISYQKSRPHCDGMATVRRARTWEGERGTGASGWAGTTLSG